MPKQQRQSSLEKEIVELKLQIQSMHQQINDENVLFDETYATLNNTLNTQAKAELETPQDEIIDLNQLKIEQYDDQCFRLVKEVQEMEEVNQNLKTQLEQILLIRHSNETQTGVILTASEIEQEKCELKIQCEQQDEKTLSKQQMLDKFFNMNNDLQDLIQMQSDQ